MSANPIQQLTSAVDNVTTIPAKMDPITAKIKILLRNNQEQKAQIAELQDQNKTLTDRALEAEEKNAAKDAQIAQLNKTNIEQAQTIENKAKENTQLSRNIDELNQAIESLKEKLLTFTTDHSTRLDSQLELLKDIKLNQ